MKVWHTVAIIISLATFALGAATTQPADPVAAVVARVHVGMTSKEFRDTVETLLPGGGISGLVSGDALGLFESVRLDADTSVVVYYGKNVDINVPPDTKVVSVQVNRFEDLKGEIPADLYPCVHMVHLLPDFEADSYDPAALIRVINSLQPLGKEKAIRVLRVYQRLAGWDTSALAGKQGPELERASDELTKAQTRALRYGIDDYSLALVPGLLFVAADGEPLKIMNIGAPYIDDGKPMPLYPMILSDDVPFIIRFPSPASRRPDLESALAPVEDEAKMRPTLLRPQGDPLRAAQALLASPLWAKLFQDPQKDAKQNQEDAEQCARAVKLQALRMVSRFTADELPAFSWGHNDKVDALWQDYLNRPSLKSIRWDAPRQRFVIPGKAAP